MNERYLTKSEKRPVQVDRDPIIHKPSSNPKLVKAATIWFLLIEESMIPTERNRELSKRSPRYPLIIGPTSRLPKGIIRRGNRQVSITMIKSRIQLAINLPRTTWVSVTGEVRISSIVPDLRSSAKSFIVKAGVKKRRIKLVFWNRYSMTKALDPWD